MHPDSRTKANILNKQFVSVFTNEDDSDLPDLDSNPYPTMDKIEVSIEGVAIKLLRNLKAQKNCRPRWPFIKVAQRNSNRICSCHLTAISIIHQSGYSSIYLEKKALVVPLFKKGCRSSAVNYRHISLTAILRKLCEHILHCAVICHLTAHNILSDAKHGF